MSFGYGPAKDKHDMIPLTRAAWNVVCRSSIPQKSIAHLLPGEAARHSAAW